jgi:hypothetical protein
VEKHVVNADLMKQVTDFTIADGGPAAAGVEQHGKERPIGDAGSDVPGNGRLI